MKIRLATLDDYRVCAEIHMSARARMAYLPPNLHTAEETHEWMRDVVFQSERVWVAEHADRIVGYASADGEFLNNLYVLPEHQGRGIGTALLAAVMKHSRDGVKLWTFEPNEAAIRFYERHGFRTLRRTDGHTNEENVPDRLMVWRPDDFACAVNGGAEADHGRGEPQLDGADSACPLARTRTAERVLPGRKGSARGTQRRAKEFDRN